MAFFQDQKPQRQPAIQAPAVVIGLIAVIVLAHLARIGASIGFASQTFAEYALIPARYSESFLAAHGYSGGTLTEKLVPFISYAFLHADFAHLLINCLWLLAFGPIVARRFGSALFLVYFLVCAVAGGLAHVLCNWASLAPVIGASGAIAGLMAGGIRMLRLDGGLAGLGTLYRAPLAPLLSRQVVLFSAVWFAINAVAGLTGFGTGPGVYVVAWQAHVGGYFAGLLLAGPFDALHRRWNARAHS